jgi:hypothetical protein
MEVIFSERGQELILLESFKYSKKSSTKQGQFTCESHLGNRFI